MPVGTVAAIVTATTAFQVVVQFGKHEVRPVFVVVYAFYQLVERGQQALGLRSHHAVDGHEAVVAKTAVGGAF